MNLVKLTNFIENLYVIEVLNDTILGWKDAKFDWNEIITTIQFITLKKIQILVDKLNQVPNKKLCSNNKTNHKHNGTKTSNWKFHNLNRNPIIVL